MSFLTNELLIIYTNKTNKNVNYVHLYCNTNLFREKFYLLLSTVVSLKEILLMLSCITRFLPAAKILRNLIRLINTELISFFTKTDM